ncbi:hypothetical protein Tco_1042143 [Tanacetum coccineum]|uniref:Uncharacterized protein n=1 Tax=Tanacetum coccineum TaxID=301880 RepID=A0ABQ5GI76_9ASTR
MKSCGIADHDVEITLAQALTKLKSAKPKADKVVIQEPEQGASTYTNNFFTTTITGGSGQGLQAQEQEELTDEEKARLFVKFLEQRRNILQLREQKKRGTDHKQELKKGVSCSEYLCYYRSGLVEESSKKAESKITHESSLKRAGEELEQESSKKQKLEEDKESEELKQCLEIIPNDGDDVTIDATPLSTKSPTIVDYKIYIEGKKSYFQIIRVDFKVRFKKTEPVNYMDNFLLLNLKTMFEHHVKDNNMLFYLLVEKMYPLTNHTLHQMFNDVKLQVDYESEMTFELPGLVKKQLKEGYGKIVGIKMLLEDLEVTAAKLMLLVYKLLLLVLKVNDVSTKVIIAQRLRLLKEFLLSEKG